ncbi:MAG: PadR family transcriptional regulator [Chitinophagales bacterium]|nr:PadR family transcriptional regulator [Chitinophagales bacterium]
MKESELDKIRSKMVSQMRRGVLELCILSIVSEKAAYPSDIMEELKASQLIVKEGTIYPLLTRLKNQGFLHYKWEESTMGPPRKYYSTTPSGKIFLAELKNTWDSLVKAVNQSTKNISTNE